MPHLVLTLLVLAATQTVCATFQQESGGTSTCERCGLKLCGIHAVCNRRTQECECPVKYPFGVPTAECHEDDKITCFVISDPYVVDFDGHGHRVATLCPRQLVSLRTGCTADLSKSNGIKGIQSFGLNLKNNRCFISAWTINGISQHGTYFLQRVEVTLKVEVLGNPVLDIGIIFSGDEVALSLKALAGSSLEVKIGKSDVLNCKNRNFGPLAYLLCYDHNNKYWKLNLIHCGGASISFRPWDNRTENQVPAAFASFAITETKSQFSDESAYPQTTCGTVLGDDPEKPKTSCKKLGFTNLKACEILATFNFSGSYKGASGQCSNIRDKLRNLTPDVQAQALTHCGNIFGFVHCLAKNNLHPLDLFEQCCDAIRNGTPTADIIKKIRGGGAGCSSFNLPSNIVRILPKPVRVSEGRGSREQSEGRGSREQQ